jgi:membrane-associated protein
MIDTIVDWFGPLYSGALGYGLIAALILFDRAAFTGVFLPGELFLALGGVFAARGELALVPVIVVGVLAGVVGESVSYWLGRSYGRSIIRHLPLANRFEKHLDEAQRYFDRNGGRTVFGGRYVSVVGTFTPFVAGMAKMSFLRFLFADVAALSLWATGIGLLGYFLNAQIRLVDEILSRFGWGALVLAALFFGGRWLWDRRDRLASWFKRNASERRA